MTNALPIESTPSRLSLRVRQIRFEGTGIQSYELVHPAGEPLPPFSAGAHLDIHLGAGLVRQYSLCNDPRERHRYVIAVLRDEQGRGGSRTVHESLRVQGVVPVSPPRNNFQLVDGAAKVILLAGGIGITPLKAMAHALEARGEDFELHYCARDADGAAFRDEFAGLIARGRLHFHFAGSVPSTRLDMTALLSAPAEGTHLYCCGPVRFMEACAAAAAHWPAGTVHFEHFKAPERPASDDAAVQTGTAAIRIASTGELVEVPAGQSLVDVLGGVGIQVETSCQSGLCGTCKLRYLSGDVRHLDFVLSDSERAEYLTACVSRPKSGVVVLEI